MTTPGLAYRVTFELPTWQGLQVPPIDVVDVAGPSTRPVRTAITEHLRAYIAGVDLQVRISDERLRGRVLAGVHAREIGRVILVELAPPDRTRTGDP